MDFFGEPVSNPTESSFDVLSDLIFSDSLNEIIAAKRIFLSTNFQLDGLCFSQSIFGSVICKASVALD